MDRTHSVLKRHLETLRITWLVLLPAADTKTMLDIEGQKIGNGEITFLPIFFLFLKKKGRNKADNNGTLNLFYSVFI